MIIVVTYHLKALGNQQYLQIFTIMIKHEKDKKRIKHIILDPFIRKFIHKYT